MSNDRPDTPDGPNGPHEGNGSSSGEWWDQPDADSFNTYAGSDGNSLDDESSDNTDLGSDGDTNDDVAAEPEMTSASESESTAGQSAPEDHEEEDSMAQEEQPANNKRRILAWLGLAAVLVILLPVVVFGVAYAATDVPEPEELANNQIAVIYDRTGEKELTRIVPEGGNRSNVTIDKVPDAVRNAVLAAEDRDFYSNPGFSLTGYGRAALGVITGNSSAGGGSTITQQYVKNAVVGNERTITRKAKELVMSAKMAREWTKDEILEAYLNTIYFGRNAYGIAAASKAYFNKDISDLNVEEGAVLAASIQRPSALDPWTNRPEAEHRWNYVLDGLVEMKVITPEDRASMQYPETIDPALAPQQVPEPGPAAMIKNQVLAELERKGISEQEVNTGGLKITTTIDPTVQQAALDAMDNYVDQETGLRAAIVSVEPKTGAVRAYYGGDDPTGWDYANSGLQTGSTFKIFALAAALDQGIPLSAQYSSAPVQSGNATLYNSDGAGGGVVPLYEALKQSLNTPFIRLQRDLKNGPDDTAKMAHRLGVAESIPGVEKTLMDDNGHSQDGITLGQYLTRPLDMAVGLGTLTNDGVYQETHFVEKVENSKGEVIYEANKGSGDRRVSKAVATNVISAMQPIAGYSNKPLSGGRASAAKTGTTQLGDSGLNKDAWMIGSTPQLSTAVWVGNVDGSALYNSSGGIMYGSQTPGDLWKYTMDNALANKDFESFSQPESVGGVAGAPQYTAPQQTYESPQYQEETTEEQTQEETTEAPAPEIEIPIPGGDGGAGGAGGGLADLLPIPGFGGAGGGGDAGGGADTGGGEAPAGGDQ
ncbi:MAG: transglycosylase domain-containing protein [Corynebacterium sp.]|uniref:transglycosylase domain-containing protein n=1 Tax=Corynebacterium sp. TaxID=1720 RepID=UPI0026DBA224|nr:transglycosylase domain-containing protein [Corynebacterium sp.]MDO5030222.1 transglycosylase domain-containing protein [Corynebacterium sp.]